nr:EutP/PduV family microcompartment system protein [Vagococcus allomyrinae]
MVKKMMLVGAVGTGKTTLTQRLNGTDIVYQKTQAIEHSVDIIDTPGEFTQRRHYYSALQVTSVEVDVIGLLQSVKENFATFPPGFTTMFSKHSIGIVTKIDLATSTDEIAKAITSLKAAGARQIFQVSATTNQGVAELLAFLAEEKEDGE